MRNVTCFLILSLLFVVLFILDLRFGSVDIPLSEIKSYILEGDTSKKTWSVILGEIRIPRIITAIMAGAALAISGLFMQTLFRNPLAGPYVLGISSGASLGVALWTLFGFMTFSGGISGQLICAAIGSITVFSIILLFSRYISDPTVLLLVGFLLGTVTGGIVSLLVYFSNTTELESFLIWSFGSFGRVPKEQIGLFAIGIGLPIFVSLPFCKTMNAFLMGPQMALSLGISLTYVRMLLILLSSSLAAVVTVFCGPIGFLGIAVPHLCRAIFKTQNHFILVPACIISGASFCLLSDLIAHWPSSQLKLPLNAVTATLGAPIVMIAILQGNRKGQR